MNKKETLYKYDTKGKLRIWYIEYDDEKYRTVSGLEDGKKVESGWIYPNEKNVGRSNSTTISEQVVSEVESEYEKKMYQGKYHPTKEGALEGAKFVEPMLAQKYNPSKNVKFPYYSQPKLDGIRCIATKDGLFTRNGKDIVSCPHIENSLTKFFEKNPSVILDGELYNHALKHDFEQIVSLVRKTKPDIDDFQKCKEFVEYHVYDIVDVEKPFEKRLNFLTNNVMKMFSHVNVVKTDVVNNQEELKEKMADYLEKGYEGQIIREIESPYEKKRSKHLMKNKTFDDAEFKIVSVEEGVGNWAGKAKSIVIDLGNGVTQSCGMRGSFEFAEELNEQANEYIGTEVTVTYQGTTNDGKLRFPIATHFWKGKRQI